MIHEIKNGDLFKSKCQTLTNTVNCVGVMGAGIAKEFKRLYPAMFSEYRHNCNAGRIKPGRLSVWKIPQTHNQILNFPTKDHWRNPSRIEYVEMGLRYMVENWQALGIESLAIPALGCNNGGLAWIDVKPIMLSYLENIPIPIEIYDPR